MPDADLNAEWKTMLAGLTAKITAMNAELDNPTKLPLSDFPLDKKYFERVQLRAVLLLEDAVKGRNRKSGGRICSLTGESLEQAEEDLFSGLPGIKAPYNEEAARQAAAIAAARKAVECLGTAIGEPPPEAAAEGPTG